MTSLDALVATALAAYDLPEGATAELVNVSENSTYRVDGPSGNPIAALRVHRPAYHTAAQIESELMWLDALRADGVVEPPVPLTARNGARVLTLPTDDRTVRHVSMFAWLPGAAPTTDGDLSAAFAELGRLAARMHLHGLAWRRPSSFDRYTVDEDVVLDPQALWGRWQEGPGLGPAERTLFDRVDARIRSDLADYGKAPDRFGLAHNDLRLANLLIDETQIRVIDFDDCGTSWFLWDFATAVSFIEDDPRVGEWMHAWVAGYLEHRPLASADIAAIPALVMLRRLLLIGWVGSHSAYAAEAAELGAGYTTSACGIAEAYVNGRFLTA